MKFLLALTFTFIINLGKSQQIGHSTNRIIPLPFADYIVGEPHLSVHPTDKKKMLAAAVIINPTNRDSIYTCILTTSDGGEKWIIHNLNYGSSNDPWTLITNEGHYIVSTLYEDGILIHFSDNFGQSWNKPFLVEGAKNKNNFDHPTLAESFGTVYMCGEKRTKKGDDIIEEIVIAESIDGGRTFPNQRSIKTGNIGMNTLTITTLQDGSLIVPFSLYQYDYSDTSIRIPKIHYSYRFQNLYDDDLFPRFVTSAEGKGFPVMYNVSNQTIERLFYVFTSASGDQLLYSYSDNGGSTWNFHRKVFDNFHSRSVYFPQIVSDNVGNILIAWFDKDRENKQRVQVSYSSDLGNTFSRPYTISDIIFDNQSSGNGWTKTNFAIAGGHYFGLVSTGEKEFALIWSDSRSGKLQLYFTKVTIYPSSEVY